MRHKLLSLINIFCLSIGITFCLLIGIYISNEKNINSTNSNINNQYILKSIWKDENTAPSTTTVGPLAKALKEKYPSLIENYYRFDPLSGIVSAGEKHFREDIAIADTSLVSMYGFPLLEGSKTAAFRNDRSAVVTELFARKFFGKTDVLDKVITIHTPKGTREDFVISAVLKNMPFNSVTNYNTGRNYQVFVPIASDTLFRLQHYGDNWNILFVTGMVELKPGIDPDKVAAIIPSILKSNTSPFIQSGLTVALEPMKDFHLQENNGFVKRMISILSLAGTFILLMAVINFVNISIGTSSWRVKEIGLRKVFGGSRARLVRQYIFEAIVLTCLAGLVSLIFYEALRPVFNDLLHTTLVPLRQFELNNILKVFALVILLGVVAGVYPSFVVSAVKATTAVKGITDTAKGGVGFRKALLTVQFTVAVVVFIVSIIISRQVAFFFSKDPGYKKEQVMIISSLPHQWDSSGIIKMEAIRNRFADIAGVNIASLSCGIPDGKPEGSAGFSPNGKGGKKITCPIMIADENFASVYNIPVKEGDFFSHERYLPGQLVFNESALKGLGWENATGKYAGRLIGRQFTVAGVIKDFHIASLHENIQPLAFLHIRDMKAYEYMSVKLDPGPVQTTITAIESKWKEWFPDTPFEYFFMDDKFQSLYEADIQLQKASGIASALTFIIVLLGIAGVVSFTVMKRSKEIAVRKVLGAARWNIIQIFLKEYAGLILFANIIGWPLAYLASDKLLENYAYRIPQSIFPFLWVGVFILVAVFCAVIIQCFKAASANPIVKLRND